MESPPSFHAACSGADSHRSYVAGARYFLFNLVPLPIWEEALVSGPSADNDPKKFLYHRD
jgi:hypothetical protein